MSRRLSDFKPGSRRLNVTVIDTDELKSILRTRHTLVEQLRTQEARIRHELRSHLAEIDRIEIELKGRVDRHPSSHIVNTPDL